MRTYAEYLNTMTVKTLNTLAKDMQLKGYSKLRKAELITFIEGEILIDWDGAAQRDADLYPVLAEVKPVVCMYCGARFANVQASIDHIDAHTAEETDALFAEIFDSAPLKREIIDARPLALVTGGTASERSDTWGINMRPVAEFVAQMPATNEGRAKACLAKPAIKATPAVSTPDDNEASTEELTAAYVQMRLTLNTLATSTARANLIKRVRGISAILKARGVKPARM